MLAMSSFSGLQIQGGNCPHGGTAARTLRWSRIALLIASVLPAVSSAQSTAQTADFVVKPGLWESVLKNPKIEEMASQSQAGFGKNHAPEPEATTKPGKAADTPGLRSQACVNEQTIRKVGMPADSRRDCEYKTIWTGNKAKLDTFCNGVVSYGEVVYSDAESFIGWIHPSAPWGIGTIALTGRWLSSDCGDVKPVE